MDLVKEYYKVHQFFCRNYLIRNPIKVNMCQILRGDDDHRSGEHKIEECILPAAIVNL